MYARRSIEPTLNRNWCGGMANTHKDNNEIPLRAKEVLPGMVGGHKKVISYFLRNGVASVTPFPVSAVLPRG